MDRALTVKIADFGLAGATLQHSGWGTPAFMAPELFEGRPYNGKVDVYAFGVLLNEMFTLQKPWSHDEPDIVKEAVLQGKRPDVTLSAPPGVKDLVESCWAQDANARPSFTEICRTLDMIAG